MWQPDIAGAIQLMDKIPSLRWVHLRNAGVPEALIAACEARGLILTNGSGAQASAIAEYVACALLALCKRLPDLLDSQRRAVWRSDVGVVELRGQTVGILGLGALGRACVRVLQPFGVEIIGFRRTGCAVPEVPEVHTPDLLTAVLPRLNALVIAAPLTPSTRGLVGANELSLLPRGAVVVNVGRGEILDEGALIEALRAEQLGGAALDVFADEPLNPESPLWSVPNLIISPHCADSTQHTADRGLDVFLDNLERWSQGQPLRNVVRADRGY
jgi:phosphoglycerate dehydrogenase-like enzyme